MTTEADVPQPLSRDPQPAAQAEVPVWRRFGWLLRRELWESRSIVLAPLAVAGLILVGALVNAFQVPEAVRAAAALSPAQRHEAITQPYVTVSLLLMATTFFVGLFYCFDALQGERRDRSILFWKSLPVSDLETVLAKAAVPFLILPLLTVLLAVVTQGAMLGMGSVALLASGQGPAVLWTEVSLPETWLMLLYHMLAVHSLWYAPIYGWLLFVSAWATRVPWLWAILPPVAIAVVERIAFGSSAFADLVVNRMGGGAEGTEFTAASGMMDPLMHMTPGAFLLSPGLWVGLALAAALLAGAARLRRRRGPA